MANLYPHDLSTGWARSTRGLEAKSTAQGREGSDICSDYFRPEAVP